MRIRIEEVSEVSHGDVDLSVAQEMQESICYVDDQLVDEIWEDLGGCVERAQVYEVAREVESEFEDATVKMFIPIFIRRFTRERLTVEMNGKE